MVKANNINFPSNTIYNEGHIPFQMIQKKYFASYNNQMVWQL